LEKHGDVFLRIFQANQSTRTACVQTIEPEFPHASLSCDDESVE
jgi:hypothetical protein